MVFLEELRSEIEANSVSKEGDSKSSALPVPKTDGPVVDAEKHFLPFELACQSRSSRIVVTALDCIQVSYY